MKKSINHAVMKVGVILILAVLCSSSEAVVYWSSASGSADSFDWSNGQSDAGLFGNPIVSGDTFIFFPTNFRAESTGSFTEIWDTLSFDISAHTGSVITGIQITEYGDYGIIGGGLVNMIGSLTVNNTDSSSSYSAGLDATPQMPTTLGSGNWSATAAISQMNATNITVTLENGLLAFANPGSSAFIQKKCSAMPLQ